MKNLFTTLSILLSLNCLALDPNHFTITRITAPYFIVDGNSPATITKAYVGFEVKNNSNSAVTYSGLKFTILSIGTSVVGQNFATVSPANGISNIGTLAPGETRVCYFYVSYPANVTPQATFNIQVSDNTASWKLQSFVIRNRSSISANAGGTATQTFTNQDLIGGLILDDVTYVVGNVQNADESDFQVAVSSSFDPTKISLLGTQVIASSVPGIPVGATDSLYFITGNGTNGATVTIRWTFRITGTNFTNYLLPCAGATSGSTNYKYALNTSLGAGTPITVSSNANPLTITKTSDKALYLIGSLASFTITIANPGAFGVTIDKITDELPTGFTFQAMDGTSYVNTNNTLAIPTMGTTGTMTFDGGVQSGANTSFYVPAGGSITLKYSALAPASSASNLLTTARDYVAATEIGSAQNIVSVSTTLPVTLLQFSGDWINNFAKLTWRTVNEMNADYIAVEKSSDGINFISVQQITCIGTSGTEQVYSFLDSVPLPGYNKYRLKMVDKDGQFTYSTVIVLNKVATGFDIQKVFPIPFIDKLNVQVTADKKQQLHFSIFDLAGKLVHTQKINCEKGVNTILIDKLNEVQSGSYILRAVSATGSKQFSLIKLK